MSLGTESGAAAAMWADLGFAIRDGLSGSSSVGLGAAHPIRWVCSGGCSPGLAKDFIFTSKQKVGMQAHRECCIVRDQAHILPALQAEPWASAL